MTSVVLLRGVNDGSQCSINAITDATEAATGFRPRVMCIAKAAFKAIATQVPFDEAAGRLVHIWTASQRFTFDQALADTLLGTRESLHITEAAVYLHAPKGIGRSKPAEKIESLAGLPCTARNLNTVNKLVEKLDAR